MMSTGCGRSAACRFLEVDVNVGFYTSLGLAFSNCDDGVLGSIVNKRCNSGIRQVVGVFNSDSYDVVTGWLLEGDAVQVRRQVDRCNCERGTHEEAQ